VSQLCLYWRKRGRREVENKDGNICQEFWVAVLESRPKN